MRQTTFARLLAQYRTAERQTLVASMQLVERMHAKLAQLQNMRR